MKIKSITEAFSMQPNYFSVCAYDHKHGDECLKEINEELQPDGENILIKYYVGWNFNDKMIFKYLANSVNVHYFT